MKKTITLYHNSECSKSRAVLEILEASGVKFTVVDYLSYPPTERLLDQLLDELKLKPEQIVRTSEDEYKSLNLAVSPPQNRTAWIKTLVETPILIERPIVSNGETAVVGRPPEKVVEWLRSIGLV